MVDDKQERLSFSPQSDSEEDSVPNERDLLYQEYVMLENPGMTFEEYEIEKELSKMTLSDR